MNLTDGQKHEAATHVSWWLTEEGKEVKREEKNNKEKKEKKPTSCRHKIRPRA